MRTDLALIAEAAKAAMDGLLYLPIVPPLVINVAGTTLLTLPLSILLSSASGSCKSRLDVRSAHDSREPTSQSISGWCLKLAQLRF